MSCVLLSLGCSCAIRAADRPAPTCYKQCHKLSSIHCWVELWVILQVCMAGSAQVQLLSAPRTVSWHGCGYTAGAHHARP